MRGGGDLVFGGGSLSIRATTAVGSCKGGVLISCSTIDPHPNNAGTEARRVFTDQADIACTKRETP